MHGDGSKWGPIRCACNVEVRQFVVNADDDVDTDHFDETVDAVWGSDRLELVALHCRMDARAAVAPHGYAEAVDAMVAKMARIRLSREQFRAVSVWLGRWGIRLGPLPP